MMQLHNVVCLFRLMDERTSYVYVLRASFGSWIKERGVYYFTHQVHFTYAMQAAYFMMFMQRVCVHELQVQFPPRGSRDRGLMWSAML